MKQKYKKHLSVRQNRLAPFSRLGRKIMETHVRIYSQWQQSKRELA